MKQHGRVRARVMGVMSRRRGRNPAVPLQWFGQGRWNCRCVHCHCAVISSVLDTFTAWRYSPDLTLLKPKLGVTKGSHAWC